MILMTIVGTRDVAISYIKNNVDENIIVVYDKDVYWTKLKSISSILNLLHFQYLNNRSPNTYEKAINGLQIWSSLRFYSRWNYLKNFIRKFDFNYIESLF